MSIAYERRKLERLRRELLRATRVMEINGMVGGIVVEASEIKLMPKALFVDVRDRADSTDKCLLLLEKTPVTLCIEIGDALWWQGDIAFWTPAKVKKMSNEERKRRRYKNGIHYDIKIPRIPFTGSVHPDQR